MKHIMESNKSDQMLDICLDTYDGKESDQILDICLNTYGKESDKNVHKSKRRSNVTYLAMMIKSIHTLIAAFAMLATFAYLSKFSKQFISSNNYQKW